MILLPVLAWLIWRRPGYKRDLLDRPPPGWVLTGEAFIDPISAEAVRVWVDPVSGDRAYVRAISGG
jgi:hypothetical protein